MGDDSYPGVLQDLLGYGYNVVNCGAGGENTLTIMARLGAYPMLLAHDVVLFNGGERIPEVYYWIISKNLQEEVIIKIDGGISAESYLFNTQYLSNDNKLYCLGYIWENKDMESFEENLNPSVVALEFNELFSKVR